jgi:hypothetical protein
MPGMKIPRGLLRGTGRDVEEVPTGMLRRYRQVSTEHGASKYRARYAEQVQGYRAIRYRQGAAEVPVRMC